MRPRWQMNLLVNTPDPLIKAIRWFKRCPECTKRPDRQLLSITPRWDQDPLVKRFKWDTPDRCSRCGTKIN